MPPLFFGPYQTAGMDVRAGQRSRIPAFQHSSIPAHRSAPASSHSARNRMLVEGSRKLLERCTHMHARRLLACMPSNATCVCAAPASTNIDPRPAQRPSTATLIRGEREEALMQSKASILAPQLLGQSVSLRVNTRASALCTSHLPQTQRESATRPDSSYDINSPQGWPLQQRSAHFS